ncbi:MAG: HK97 family phage prohead protease [Candidatus Babeliales bacterium]
MDKIIKTHIGEIKSIDEKNFTVEAVVSDDTIDRYQEVIKVDAWKRGLGSYKKHGPLLSSHNYGSLLNQIGVAERVRVEDNALVAKFKYFVGNGNAEADWAFHLAKQGLAAYSVGFLPRPGGYETANWDDEDVKSGKKPVRTYTDVELLEISQVTVPANPSALQKSMGENKDEFMKDYYELVQQKLFSSQEEIIPLENEDISDMVTKDLGDEAITKPDTEGYVHIGVDEGNHSDHKIRTMSISKEEGIQAHYCVDCKKITGYLFDKSKGWTHEKASAWVKEHNKIMVMGCSPEDLYKLAIEYDKLTEEDKKKPKGGCKSEEDEEMILKAIEDFKKEITEKIDKIESRLTKWDDEDAKIQEELETLANAIDEQGRKDEEDAVTKQIEEDEDYIKSVLTDMQSFTAKFSVQSK